MTDSDAFEPDQRLEQQATSFGSAADLYERGRPSYPQRPSPGSCRRGRRMSSTSAPGPAS